MSNSKQIGKIGEQLACKYLEKLGYKIIQRNFYSRQGEIDIIAKQDKMIIFIEVKTRTNEQFGKPAEAVNRIKKKHIYQTAKYYLYNTKQEKKNIRFDVIEVYIKNGKIKFNHIKQIM